MSPICWFTAAMATVFASAILFVVLSDVRHGRKVRR
jgi:hypothetical protein